MAKTRLWRLTDKDLPKQFHIIRDVFIAGPRQPGESLHDYFMRRGIKCFCPKCRSVQ